MGKVPSKTTPCSPSTRLPAPARVWFFSHYPSLSHRRLAMINKTNNYPVTSDCRPTAGQQHVAGGTKAIIETLMEIVHTLGVDPGLGCKG